MNKKENLIGYYIRLNRDVLDGIGKMARMKRSTKAQLIRDAILSYLVREYRHEQKQDIEYQKMLDDIQCPVPHAFRSAREEDEYYKDL